MWPNAKHIVSPHPAYELFGNKISKTDAREKLGLPFNNVILFFCYIRNYKGVHILLDALRIVNDKLNVKLIIAGDFYENEEKYRKHISDLNLISPPDTF